MQVARATAGLVTGQLPEVRLVSRVGEAQFPPRSRPLGISEKSLKIVRDSLVDTVRSAHGTAHISELSEESLGFRFACKTGSADVKKIEKSALQTKEDEADMLAGKMLKHTWVAGWFPAENPRAILVVYLHFVTETATHSSVYIAEQMLHSEAVQRFARGGK
jgi:cell division protein FtsI/penicillin-binding protein 2